MSRTRGHKKSVHGGKWALVKSITSRTRRVVCRTIFAKELFAFDMVHLGKECIPSNKELADYWF